MAVRIINCIKHFYDMKKLIPILFAALLFASCQKEPKMSELDNELVVYTSYDKTAEFGNYMYVYVPDSILLIAESTSEEPVYWTSANAAPIIQDFEDHLTARGYMLTDDKKEADLGLQISYFQNTSYFAGGNNNWWYNYPGYWNPGYWYPGGSDWNWYYPYYVPIYSYNVGALMSELIDLKNITPATEKIDVIWNAYMSGLVSGSDKFDLQLSLNAVNQAFVQSPYIKATK